MLTATVMQVSIIYFSWDHVSKGINNQALAAYWLEKLWHIWVTLYMPTYIHVNIMYSGKINHSKLRRSLVATCMHTGLVSKVNIYRIIILIQKLKKSKALFSLHFFFLLLKKSLACFSMDNIANIKNKGSMWQANNKKY